MTHQSIFGNVRTVVSKLFLLEKKSSQKKVIVKHVRFSEKRIDNHDILGLQKSMWLRQKNAWW